MVSLCHLCGRDIREGYKRGVYTVQEIWSVPFCFGVQLPAMWLALGKRSNLLILVNQWSVTICIVRTDICHNVTICYAIIQNINPASFGRKLQIVVMSSASTGRLFSWVVCKQNLSETDLILKYSIAHTVLYNTWNVCVWGVVFSRVDAHWCC